MATDYFIDSDNGNDSNDGLGIGAGNAWKTIAKYVSNARAAGDLGIFRRGMTTNYGAGLDIQVSTDGTKALPIQAEADYDDAWGDQVDLSGTATATTTFGSKTVTYSADISGALAAGDWIYVSGDDTREFAYEVDSVAGATVTLFLPFKGTAGSGLTTFNMQSMPLVNEVTDVANALNLSTAQNWLFRGLHFSSTDPNGTVQVSASNGLAYIDCVWSGNGAGDFAFKLVNRANRMTLTKCRFFNHVTALKAVAGDGGWISTARDCLFDGNNVSSSSAIDMIEGTNATFIDCEFKDHATGDVMLTSGINNSYSRVQLRNCILSSTTEIDSHQVALDAQVFIEDYDGEPGSTRQLTHLSQAEGTPTLQSETGTTRAGGATISAKVTGSDSLSPAQGYLTSQILLFEIPFYATTAAKTYSVYFRPTATADWTADPIASELWIEAEYWNHATNDFRVIKKSTGVIDMNGSTTWTALTVAATPAQAGVLYLRGYYAKTKEGGKANTFYMDPLPEVS